MIDKKDIETAVSTRPLTTEDWGLLAAALQEAISQWEYDNVKLNDYKTSAASAAYRTLAKIHAALVMVECVRCDIIETVTLGDAIARGYDALEGSYVCLSCIEYELAELEQLFIDEEGN